MTNDIMMPTGRYLSPIRLLYDDIMNSYYENSHVTKLRLDDLVERGLIRQRIFFNPEQVGLRTPKVNLISQVIEVHEPYMSFLWCLIYNFIFINDASLKLMNEGVKVIRITNFSVEGLEEVNQLVGWAMSLKKEYSPWPYHLPHPGSPGTRIQMANVMLIEVVKYLLYHEVAHLANNHISYFQLISTPADELSNDELLQLKELEIDADNYAFDMLVGRDLNHDSYNQALACVMAQLANLFVIKKTRQLKQPKHPDIDIRLFNLMNKVQFEDPRYQMNIDQTLNMGLSLFLHINKISYIPPDPDQVTWHETFEEVLRHLYDKVEDEKNNAASHPENDEMDNM